MGNRRKYEPRMQSVWWRRASERSHNGLKWYCPGPDVPVSFINDVSMNIQRMFQCISWRDLVFRFAGNLDDNPIIFKLRFFGTVRVISPSQIIVSSLVFFRCSGKQSFHLIFFSPQIICSFFSPFSTFSPFTFVQFCSLWLKHRFLCMSLRSWNTGSNNER